MCGIAGIISLDTQTINEHLLKKMTDAIAHRGPDGEGQWVSDNSQVGLGHRRLSILDLSETANQPMHFGGRYTIVFNGEIYNYLEIKERLQHKQYQFRTTSDTEVLMALYHEKKENCLQDLDGMFAFVIYDKEENTVFVARDRFGEKPFYYSKSANSFVFASEMKALWAAGIPKVSNNVMFYKFLSSGDIENFDNKKETFYKDIFCLPAATYLKINVNSLSIVEKQYWDINPQVINDDITLQKAAARFRELFYISVKRRLRSDVPVGSSLSGGLDSSLVVSVMDNLDHKKQINRKTFSAQFPGFAKDESFYQQLIIDKTHVEPHFVRPTEHSMLANLEKIMYHQEEPFGSASIAAQYEVFELAKQQKITVLLDGQGADEILAGYHGYFFTFFNQLAKSNKANYKQQWEAYQQTHHHNTINLQDRQQSYWKTAIKRKLPVPVKNQIKSFYQKITNRDNPAGIDQEFIASYKKETNQKTLGDNLNEVLYYSTRINGLEQLLRYADRNSMAHSREVRLPFLYHELVEFIFTLPFLFKINNGWTKFLMRYSFEDLLPKEICWRADKIGYEPPQRKWLQNKQVNEQLIQAISKLSTIGILDKKRAQVCKDKGLADLDHTLAWRYLMAARYIN
jgi:asparagine synthase (glutamine-hydrolysing)